MTAPPKRKPKRTAIIRGVMVGVLTGMLVSITACKDTLLNAVGKPMINASEVYTDEGVIQLANAVQKGDVKQIKALVAQGVDVNARTEKEGYNLLIWAMLNQNKKGLIALLEAGADPAVGDNEGDTILHWAASANDPSYLKLLLDQGVDPNLRGKVGAPALRNAIMGDRVENFKVLLAAGADPNARLNSFPDGSLGDTILHTAAGTSSSERVIDLLNAGADPLALDAFGDTFQDAFFSMNEEIMTSEGKARREQVRAWLRERNIPVEDGQ